MSSQSFLVSHFVVCFCLFEIIDLCETLLIMQSMYLSVYPSNYLSIYYLHDYMYQV